MQLYSAQKHDHDVSPTTEFSVTGNVKRNYVRIQDLKAFREEALGNTVVKSRHGDEKEVVKDLKGIQLKAILDSANIFMEKITKNLGSWLLLLTASDGYVNTYSWNELFNTTVRGSRIYYHRNGRQADKRYG